MKKIITVLILSFFLPGMGQGDEKREGNAPGKSGSEDLLKSFAIEEGSKGVIQFLVGENFKKFLESHPRVKNVNSFTLTSFFHEKISSKKISIKVGGQASLRELRKLLSGMLADLVAQSGGKVLQSELVFPPATFSLLSEVSDRNLKIDGVVYPGLDGGKTIVLFLTKFGD